MEFAAKACLAKPVKTKSMVKICIIGTIALAGLVLGIVSFVQANILFGAVYLLAFLLGIAYVVIQVNTIMPTFLAVRGRQVVMQNWRNGIFSFDPEFRPGFLCDFIPDKTEIRQIDISRLTKLLIGTNSFLRRNLPNTQFAADMETLAQANPRCARLLRRLDLIYMETIDGDCFYMSIDRFDPAEVVRVLTEIQRCAPQLQIRCNSRDIRRRMNQSQ